MSDQLKTRRVAIDGGHIDRLVEFLIGEFEDPMHAALAALTAYVLLCEQHSNAPDRAAIVRHATHVIMSVAAHEEPDEMRPN